MADHIDKLAHKPAASRAWNAGISKLQSAGETEGDLQQELQTRAANRLGTLALVTSGTFILFSLANTPIGFAVKSREHTLVAIPCVLLGMLLSMTIAVLARRMSDPRLILKIGVLYQILLAVILGLMDNYALSHAVANPRGWSFVAAWILVYAFFISSEPRRTLLVSSIVALVDPLTLLLAVALGAHAPPLIIVPAMFAPTAVAVLTAYIAARINYRLGKKLHDAREMGSYRLLERLGRGGMGEVWRAEHRLLARPAAIKLIKADFLAGSGEGSQSAQIRFEREAQATALLQSEHTIEIYDFGVANDGSLYYVMELLDGLDLEEIMKTSGPLPPERVVHCLIQACESLAEAHESGLIHRDIKPSNIFVCRKGLRYDYVKVLDFGLVKATEPIDAGADAVSAKLTADHAISGTPAYMVPEIIEGSTAIDGRADLYALGCVAYYLLSGRLVFEADSPMVVLMNHMRADPVRLSRRASQEIPPELEEIVHACLEKDPNLRPASAQQLIERLEQAELVGWTQESAARWWETYRKPAGDQPVDPYDETLVESEPPVSVETVPGGRPSSE